MKLSAIDTTHLKELLSICALADIESIIIENGTVRGVSAEKTCAIISSVNVPAFSQKIGLSRLASLRSRIDLFSTKDAVIDAKETDRGEISQLEISSAKSKVQFRCTSTALIKAPQSINDRHDVSIYINKEEIKMILDGIKVMGAKRVIMTMSKDSVNFKIADESNDALNLQLETKPSIENDDSEDPLVVCYSTKVFPAILRAASQLVDTVSIKIGQRGTATIQISGQNLVVLPEVNEEEE